MFYKHVKISKFTISACKYVNQVIWNSGGTDSKPAILSVKPDIIAIGSDWALKDYYQQMDFEQSWLDELNISLIYIPYTRGISSTEIKTRL
jgi:glycerol-3-phosphate cytidylyltransferase-like family protein